MEQAIDRAAFPVVAVELSRSVLAVAIAVLLPVLVHAVPWEGGGGEGGGGGGVPLGARLLPIFIAPALVVVFGWRMWAVAATCLAPAVSYVLLGRPSGEMLGRLTVELVVFGVVVAAGWRVCWLRWVLLPGAYLVATGAAASVLTADLAAGWTAVVTALERSRAGLALLAALGALAAWRQTGKRR